MLRIASSATVGLFDCNVAQSINNDAEEDEDENQKKGEIRINNMKLRLINGRLIKAQVSKMSLQMMITDDACHWFEDIVFYL